MSDGEVEEIGRRLAAFFPEDVVSWKPQTVKDNRAMAVAYIDARDVQDRLDAVVGIMNWKDEYVPLGDGNVRCLLSVRIGGEWVTKQDVGGESEQRDAGDKTKAAFSDALKRAAIKWGIGRYLYSMPHDWHDYDPVRRRFVTRPKLPDWANPAKQKKTAPDPAPAKPADPAQAKQKGMPASGKELLERLERKDAELVAEKVCKKGELLLYVVQAGVKEGLEKDMTTWSGAAIDLSIQVVKAFEAQRRKINEAVTRGSAGAGGQRQGDMIPAPDNLAHAERR